MFGRVWSAVASGLPPVRVAGSLPRPASALKLYGDLQSTLAPLMAALPSETLPTLQLAPLADGAKGVLAAIDAAPGALSKPQQDATRSLREAIGYLDDRVHDITDRKLLRPDASLNSVREFLTRACAAVMSSK